MSDENKIISQETEETAAPSVEDTAVNTEEAATAAEAEADQAAPDAGTDTQATDEEQPADETPDETMKDYDTEINASIKPIHEGDILKGAIIGISDDELTVDLGIYTDGVVKLEDASNDPNFTFQNFAIGQEVVGTVIRRDNAQGRIQLSLKAAAEELGWEHMQQYMKDQTNITVKIHEAVKGGVTAYVEGIRGFIPASKLALSYVENLADYVGKELEVRVITAEPENRRLVLSARDILREKREEERKNRIAKIEVGTVIEGKVETIKDYGAFVSLGNGMSGLLHVSQISQQRVKNPAAVLEVGQTVKVKVIGVKDGKISLSMKALEADASKENDEGGKEHYTMPKAESVTTSLGSMLKNIKL